jgi:hypothetical protein
MTIFRRCVFRVAPRLGKSPRQHSQKAALRRELESTIPMAAEWVRVYLILCFEIS